MKQHGKKDKINWDDISASCAASHPDSGGDVILLGFGNGALLSLKQTDFDKPDIQYQDLSFSGPENAPIEKLQIMHMESSQAGVYQVESLILSLSGKMLNFHTFPAFEEQDYLEQKYSKNVLDFEYYSKSEKVTQNGKTKYVNSYFLVCLTGLLQIFKFNKKRHRFDYLTKVQPQGPSSLKQLQNNTDLPIFDGGICAQNDVLLLSYKDSAEYIRIDNIGKPSETQTKLQLWNWNASRKSSGADQKEE